MTAGAAWLACGTAWGRDVRAEWNAERLAAAGAIAGNCGALGWAAWQRGSRVAAWQRKAVAPALSITKAIAGLAAAKAIHEGWLSLNERAADTLAEWRNDPAKRGITVRMLLQQTSGLEAGDQVLYRQGIDKGRMALALRVINSPGSQFRYGPSHWEALGELLQRKLSARGSNLEAFLKRAVMRPVGLSVADWRKDAKGRVYLSTGTRLTVDQLGNLGRTIAALRRGEDRHGIAAAVYASVSQPSGANPMFGGGLWRNPRAGHQIEVEDSIDPAPSTAFWRGACLSRRQPDELVALIGSSGKRVLIWPHQDKVFARLGASRSWKDAPLLEML